MNCGATCESRGFLSRGGKRKRGGGSFVSFFPSLSLLSCLLALPCVYAVSLSLLLSLCLCCLVPYAITLRHKCVGGWQRTRRAQEMGHGEPYWPHTPQRTRRPISMHTTTLSPVHGKRKTCPYTHFLSLSPPPVPNTTRTVFSADKRTKIESKRDLLV